MNPCKPEEREYIKQLLNKMTITPSIISHIESLSIKIDKQNYSFHKISVKHWHGCQDTLFNTMANYFTSALIPINPYVQDERISFWTGNLNLILKIIKLEFKFLYERDFFDVDIVFNDRMAIDLFTKNETESDIVSDVVSRRYNDEFELDLSDFRNDAQFLKKRIVFFNINMLSYFKSVMLKVGKLTKSLNLSKNNLSKPPLPILNFFMNGEVTALNLSDNNINSLTDVFLRELFVFNKKIIKLWLDGNPLCDEFDTYEYIQKILPRFPRLSELDGLKLNPNREFPPFVRNFFATPDHSTQCIVSNFITNYFKAYDQPRRPAMNQFYDLECSFSISTQFTEAEEHAMSLYIQYGRNFCESHLKTADALNNMIYRRRPAVVKQIKLLPTTIHDLSSFNVQVLAHDSQFLVLVIDGLYFENHRNMNVHVKFSRTFTFKTYRKKSTEPHVVYCIMNDMLFVRTPWNYEIRNFRVPLTRPDAPLALVDPSIEEREAMLKVFLNITSLKKHIAIELLEAANWDMRPALIDVTKQIKSKELSPNDFERNKIYDPYALMDED